ncbi:MAG: tRNA epoxyqueuosine(34) reductase QueG [Bacteriovoracaceae bacterium]|nr:tRNA epoxyqueuosine(34) reductase QueG [Bacteriovoracaceae bacterium]
MDSKEQTTAPTLNFDLTLFAQELGWNLAGVCSPDLNDDTKQKTKVWLEDSKGPQMDYLKRRADERMNPRNYFPETESILSFGLYYFKGWASGDVKVSNYAWGEDYHTLLKNKLELTATALKERLGSFSYRICVDTAPVLEKAIATKSGLGWQGKNSLVLNPQVGSLFFLGEIFTSLPLSHFQAKLPMTDHCGNCTRCIEACPTDALTPYVLDAGKCISYWTLEHKGPFDKQTPPLSNWIAGCDICQEVCPWNQKLIPLDGSRELQNLSKEDILSSTWTEKIKNSAASYVPKENWTRNLEKITEKSS